MNLKSSAERKGKVVTEVIIGTSGIKKTYRGIKTETIEQGEFTKFELEDGRMIMVNTVNVMFVEIYSS
jgi:hypothetical protein